MTLSKKLAEIAKKFQCLFCDGECGIEYYLKEATSEEIAGLLALWKICTTHAQAISEALAKREISKTVC